MNYGWIEGSPDFKQEVASLYQNVDPENVLQANGATGANLLALMTLVEPGDHVIAEYPTYQRSMRFRARSERRWSTGISRRSWAAAQHRRAERLVRPDTKLICINNASNPLGTVLSREMLEQIVEIARSVGAYVLSDEVYLPLEDTESFVSMADLYDRAVVTNSVSKTYSVPAARIGWTVSNAEVANRIRTYRDYTLICGGIFNDALAVHVLRNRERILERNRAIVFGNRAIAQEWIDASRACAGCRRRACRPRTSSSTSPWMTRSSA